MLTIWKFPLETKDLYTLDMPAGATLLTIDIQAGRPFLWALVDSEGKREQRTFATYGTGHPVRDMAKRQAGESQVYVGSYQLLGGELVFHVFEISISIEAALAARESFKKL